MGKLIDFSNQLNKLTPSQMESELLIAVEENEETATNLNTDQLFRGEDSKGLKLPPYSRRSVEVFGKQAGPMTLFDTGDFYDVFFMKVDKFPLSIFSSDRKTGKIADLLDSRGHKPDDIYGLQKANLTDWVRNYVLEDYQKRIRNFLGLR